MALFFRLLFSVICVGILLFCCFGFMATFESLGRSVQITWRLIYGFVAVLSLAGIGFLNRPGSKKDTTE